MVKLGPPSGHKPQLEEKKRGTAFQKPAYQELSLDIKAPSQDLTKTLLQAFQYKGLHAESSPTQRARAIYTE